MILTSFEPHFIPLLRKLKDLELVTLHPQFTKMLTDGDVSAKSIGDFMDGDVQSKAAEDAVRLLTAVAATKFSANGLSPASSTLVGTKLPVYFYPRLMDAAMMVHVLDKAKPKLVLVHNDVEPMPRLVALWAKARGVPCLHVPHAIYLEHDERTPVGTDIHDLITASDIAVAGPFQQEWYAERGADLAHMRQTGLPQFDRLAVSRGERMMACRLFKLSPVRPVVVYTSSWRQDTNLLGCADAVEESYAAFLAAAKTMPDLQYIVKTHPRGRNTDEHAKKAQEAGVQAAVTEQHLDIALNAADMLVNVGTSNVVLEAATIKRLPLVCVGGGAFPNDPEVVKVKAEPVAIAQAIQNGLRNPPPELDKLIGKYLGQIDGQASERVAEWARELHA